MLTRGGVHRSASAGTSDGGEQEQQRPQEPAAGGGLGLGYASFEQHTNGIGSRLMQQMG